ncbi:hypothetical protein OKA05_03665 [Luteolibacter arcticus]|uniref:Toxin co-regulated pilus biosynthesis protein Q C-terminal domain-containing protein n=1 Tax=Luteolibacter arcticus TaxID=1581411 RepID=A0ABT3GEA6_9BACT|nr:hypothetical protein [Luteolibacter arcticus]MCW1921635.1 hypothetical protein [Luteolibacter arcticus]
MKTVVTFIIVRAAACLLVASPAMAEEAAMRDVATHDELSQKLRVANNKGPLSDFKPVEGEDPTKAEPENLVSRSDFMSFSGYATIVPKRAILHIPAAMADRIKLLPGSRVQTWAEFYPSNRGWITTVEVSRAQAEGNQPLAEELVTRIQKSRNVVVATFQGGPISVLPLKAPVETANLKKP